MTAYSWNGGGGNWRVAADWSPSGGPPKSTDSATISATGSNYTVTVNSADVASSLTLSSANATINDDGTNASLTIGGTLTISAGTFNLATTSVASGALTAGGLNLSGGAMTINTGGLLTLGGTLSQTGGTLTLNGGTIADGTIQSTAGTLVLNGWTLSGVTFDGPLNLTSTKTQQRVHLANGATVVGSAGTGSGTINVTGQNDFLFFDNVQTVSNDTINLGNASTSDFLENDDTGDAGNQVLTLAPSVTINVRGYAELAGSGASGDGIVSQGIIKQTAKGSNFYIDPLAFTNSGTIDAAAASGQFVFNPATFTNNGALDVAKGEEVFVEPTTFATTASSLIAIGANSSVTIDPSSPAWTNLGSITLASGANLYLFGSTSAASLGSISNSGGVVDVGGTWDNTDQTLDGSAAFGQLVLYGGTITGGTVTSAGVAFTSTGGTLSGLTFDGPLNLTSTQQIVHLADGAVVVGPGGSGPGTVNVTGQSSALYFDNTQTVGDETINLGNANSPAYLEQDDTIGDAQALTFAPTVTVDVIGYAQIISGYAAGDEIIDNGVIDDAGSILTIAGNAFTNNGTFTEGAGATVSISSGDTLTLEGTTSLGGETSGSGTLSLAGGPTTIVSGASITASNWTVLGSGTSVTLDKSLTYAGTFGADSGATLNLSGDNLTLTGATDSFVGAATSGSGTLKANGTTTVSGLTIGGATTFSDGGALSESGGMTTVGDSAGDVAKLTIASTGIWDILDNSGITRGASASSSITNSGLFEKTAGTGTSAITPNITNSGTVLISSGTLDLQGVVTGTGMDTISGSSTLEFDSKVESKTTLGDQNIGFAGGGALDLADPKDFWGEISNFAAGDAVDLLGNWTLSSFSENAGGTLGTLTLASGTTKHAFDFVGDFMQGSFNIVSGATTVVTHT